MFAPTVLGFGSQASSPGSSTPSSLSASTPNHNGSSSTTVQQTATDDASKSQNPRQAQKKRRIPGACDLCKKKKIRCDSGEMPGNRCSNCIQYGFECTHKEVTKTLGSAKGYVESLEARLEKMDRLLTKLLPGIDLNYEVDQLLEEIDNQGALARNDDDEVRTKLIIGRLSKLDLNPPQKRFFGKSSGYQLIQTALDLKREYKGTQSTTTPVVLTKRRPEFWEIPSWASVNPEADDSMPQYDFPPLDLIGSLVDHYFTQINPFLPLLHRPLFQKGIDEGLHHKDQYFGATVLLVCALGSRYSEDPRVFVEGSSSTRSAGWKWFEQVQALRASFFKRTSLHELQAHVLFILFAQSSEIPQGCWSQVGMALRLAQEVGAHRRRLQSGHTPTAEDELWKRAFWVLMSIDRLTSSASGRPCGLQDEDFDLDLPIECDDEYWERPDPNERFKQPEGKPSTLAFFNCYLSLMDILAYAMRAIYAIKQPKNMFGRVIQRSEQQIIAELDSAMNNWMDSVPQHLRWNPSCENKLFLKQSAALYATYYHLQVFIHRPFIPSPRNPTSVAFPSLAICTNAARSCCHVLESYSRISHLPLPYLQATVFMVAVVLLLNIWSGKRTGFAPHPKREMEDVQRCMNILKSWSQAGRYWDILTELAYAGDVTISHDPPRASSPTRKRRRMFLNEIVQTQDPPSTKSDKSTSPGPDATLPPTPSSPTSPSFLSMQHPGNVAPPNFSLPIYSTELGSLPVYGQFNFLDTVAVSQQEMARQIQMAFPPSYMFPGHFFSQRQVFQTQQSSLFNQPQVYSDPQPEASLPPRSAISAHSNPQDPSSLSDSIDLGAVFDGQLTSNVYPPNSPLTPLPSGMEAFGMDQRLQENGDPFLDHDTMSMWSSAPTGFELDEWKTYISSVNEMTRGPGDPGMQS
ncbi:hypothetical protein AN958_03435 [Leucoagaricus sp. SymC.cos]|nr:hypothetical protein AN958_03435 [Leucoagaricus sp. SymC.cos]